VVDLEIFRGGFSFTEVKTKKKGHHQLLSHFLLTAVSLDFSTTPKPPYFKVIFLFALSIVAD